MELMALVLMLLLGSYLGVEQEIGNFLLVSSAPCGGDCQSTPKVQQVVSSS